MKAFIQVMKALSELSRTRIIKLLQGHDLCVCDIAKRIGMAQPTISKHLKQLENAGLVVSHRFGKRVLYRNSEDDQNPYAAVLLGHLAQWLENGSGDPNGREGARERSKHIVDYSETDLDRIRA